MIKNLNRLDLKLFMNVVLAISGQVSFASQKYFDGNTYGLSCVSVLDKVTMSTRVKLLFEKPQDDNLIIQTKLGLSQHTISLSSTTYELKLFPERPKSLAAPLVLCPISIWDIGRYNVAEKDLLNDIAQKGGAFYIQTDPTVPIVSLRPDWRDYMKPRYWPDSDFPITPIPKQKTIWWECKYDPVLFADIQKIIRENGKIDLEEKK